MNILHRNAIRTNFALKALNGFPYAFRQSSNYLSTEADHSPPKDSSPPSPSIDPFLRTTGQGVVYGKLLGITKHTLKTDIINMFEGSNLTPDDIKLFYSSSYIPVSVMIQFPSPQAYDNAFKLIGKKGRLHRLERSDRSQWDPIMPYDGKTLRTSAWLIHRCVCQLALLQGIPQTALPDDVERFLSGCEFDSSSLRLFMKQGLQEPMKVALVRFHTRTAAMNAFITKNRSFCLNNKISVQVLQ